MFIMMNSVLDFCVSGWQPRGHRAKEWNGMDREARTAASRDGRIGVIELARPTVFNCLSVQSYDEILAALRDFEGDPAIRVVLIRAQGKHFCTGAELGEVKRMRAEDTALRHFIAHGHAVLCALEASPLPVVAAVHGLCLAGGLELAMACDVVLAAASARFGDQHAQFGLVPGWGGTQRLPRLVGLRRALDLMFSARWIEATEAERWGLVNQVVADEALQDAAIEYCRAIAERSAPGLALMKQLARGGLEDSLAEGLAQEASAVVPALLTPDVEEGLAAFEGRRKPVFG
ncbi:enoyl-CoA hydratase/isomerase family protein [Siccirubricoccus sp. KC 17139]|uniref:Enoyl-CoA hydratase/isomerase family protein n=1 Tax=Siccirubricoccus soli TaxID=2899147 RepID=A0ABT1CZY8_9PROT|nr:enoyl-CoA hydratase/isomerase family protein [Siccirubricoccus soli]MCO6415224.1 enoyl-CoA hydratase/isomerase family protein [Siccirubricoccus soli]MCP2681355.1 enoyl-CoA hydratase/isomerase family protein [Siccirubricoccus soli]